MYNNVPKSSYPMTIAIFIFVILVSIIVFVVILPLTKHWPFSYTTLYGCSNFSCTANAGKLTLSECQKTCSPPEPTGWGCSKNTYNCFPNTGNQTKDDCRISCMKADDTFVLDGQQNKVYDKYVCDEGEQNVCIRLTDAAIRLNDDDFLEQVGVSKDSAMTGAECASQCENK